MYLYLYMCAGMVVSTYWIIGVIFDMYPIDRHSKWCWLGVFIRWVWCVFAWGPIVAIEWLVKIYKSLRYARPILFVKDYPIHTLFTVVVVLWFATLIYIDHG